MTKTKILIVEDEVIIAENMCDTLNDLGYKTLEPAISYTEAIATMEEEIPDIAILDIQLSGNRNGVDLAKRIKEDYDFPFIFLTSFSDSKTVNEAKKQLPSAFLIKPFTKEELYTSIEVALFNFSKKIGQVIDDNIIIKDSLFVKDKGVYSKLKFENILYFKSDHVYLEINMKNNKKFIIRASLNEVIDKLNNNFIRVHRSYIVNTKYLLQIETASLKIENSNIPIGKKYRQNILEKLNIL